VWVALNQGTGYFDAAGNPVVVPYELWQNGVLLGTIPSDVYCAQLGLPPSVVCEPAVVVGLVALLLIPLTPQLDALLGTTVHGVAIPADSALIHITRPREDNLLPTPLRDYLDDRWVDGVYDGKPANDPDSVAAVIAELTPLPRARQAIRRYRDRTTP
jgi:hypothetical protein